MRTARGRWGRWPLLLGAVLLATVTVVAVPALGRSAHRKRAKEPTLAALAKQVSALRTREAGLRALVAGVSARASVPGAAGPKGDQGPQGARGVAGPFPNGDLPSGATIRGTYAAQLPDGTITGSASAPISFGFRLAAEPTVVVVAPAQTPRPAGCPGTIYLPEADPGVLCIYRQFENGLTAPLVYRFGSAADQDSAFADVGLSGRVGANLLLGATGGGLHLGRGTWAVTAR